MNDYHNWGWPKPVTEIYERALAALDGDWVPLHFGPGHIVWADENFDDVQWCLDNFDNYRDDYGETDLEIVRRSLIELAALSEDDLGAVDEVLNG